MSTQMQRIALATTIVVGLAAAILLSHAEAGKPPGPAITYSLQLLPTLPGSTAAHTGKMNSQGDVGGLANGATRGWTGERGFLYRNSLDRTVELNDVVFYPGTADFEDPEISAALDPGTSSAPESPVLDWLEDPKPFIVSVDDINDVGQLTGTYWFRCKGPGLATTQGTGPNGEPITHHWMLNAFRYTLASSGLPGEFEDLGTIAGQVGSHGVAINNQGHVLCVTDHAAPEVGGPAEYFVRIEGSPPITLDGIPDAENLLIGQINESGEVAGTRYELPYQRGARAFVYNYLTGGFADLGFLNNAPRRSQPESYAIGLNSASPRQTVGGSVVDLGIIRAFRHTAAGGMKDLGILTDGYKAYGQGVNKWGDTVGLCYMTSRVSSQRRAFLYVDNGGMLDVWKLVTNPQGTDGDLYTSSFPAVTINDSGWIAGTLRTERPFILRPTKWVR